jgi:ribosomal protein S12 methylthiotransferase accessory factor
MEMIIDLPGGACVDAHVGPYLIRTDQPYENGGSGSAPTPFALFLASIGTCAGIYVLGFCRQRGIPTENIRLIEHIETNPANGMVEKITLDIQLPPDFPEKYREAVIRSATQCAVKKHLELPPVFEIGASVATLLLRS